MKVRVFMKLSATAPAVARLKSDLETLLGHPLPLVQLRSSSKDGNEQEALPGPDSQAGPAAPRRDSCLNQVVLDLPMTVAKHREALNLIENSPIVDFNTPVDPAVDER